MSNQVRGTGSFREWAEIGEPLGKPRLKARPHFVETAIRAVRFHTREQEFDLKSSDQGNVQIPLWSHS